MAATKEPLRLRFLVGLGFSFLIGLEIRGLLMGRGCGRMRGDGVFRTLIRLEG